MFKRFTEQVSAYYSLLMTMIPYVFIIGLYITLYVQNEAIPGSINHARTDEPAPIQSRSVLTWSAEKTIVNSLDPATADNNVELSIMNNLMEGLTRNTGNGVEMAGALNVTIDDDGTMFTFRLRNNYWSNGQMVTAYDYEFAWDRLQKRAAENGHKTLLDDATVTYFRAYDYKTFKVKLKKPCNNFVGLVSSPQLYPVYQMTQYVEMIPMLPESMVTNGPYRLTKADESHIVLNRSRYYWDRQSVRIAQIICRFSKTWNSGYFGYRGGYVQLVDRIPVDLQQDFMLGNTAFHVAPDGYMAVLALNPTIEPTNHYNYRKAMRLSLDRVSLEDEVLGVGQVMTNKLLNYNAFRHSKWFRSEDKDFIRFDEISKVENALNLIGTTHVKAGTPVRLLVSNDERSLKYANALREMWMNNLGIQVRIDEVDERDFDEAIKTGAYHASILRVKWTDIQERGLYEMLNRLGKPFQIPFESENEDYDALYKRVEHSECLIPLAYETNTMLIHPQLKEWVYDQWGNWYFGKATFNLEE